MSGRRDRDRRLKLNRLSQFLTPFYDAVRKYAMRIRGRTHTWPSVRGSPVFGFISTIACAGSSIYTEKRRTADVLTRK
jgi:hypothetical protein